MHDVWEVHPRGHLIVWRDRTVLLLKLDKRGSNEGSQLSAGSAMPGRSELPAVRTWTSVVRSSSNLQPFRRSVPLKLGCSEPVGALQKGAHSPGWLPRLGAAPWVLVCWVLVVPMSSSVPAESLLSQHHVQC